MADKIKIIEVSSEDILGYMLLAGQESDLGLLLMLSKIYEALNHGDEVVITELK